MLQNVLLNSAWLQLLKQVIISKDVSLVSGNDGEFKVTIIVIYCMIYAIVV